MKSVFRVFILFLFFSAVPFISSAQQLGASLYIAPLAENPRAGSNFTVTIKVDSLGQPINAGRGILTFNKDKLEIINISKIGSVFNLWVEEPNFSNLEGTLKFQGGVPKPGFIGNGGAVLHVIFKAKAPGITSLVWKDGEVLASDGQGTNILVNLQNLDFSVDNALVPQTGAFSNTLVILNIILISILAFIGLFFGYRRLIKLHDEKYHHDDDDKDEEKNEELHKNQ